VAIDIDFSLIADQIIFGHIFFALGAEIPEAEVNPRLPRAVDDFRLYEHMKKWYVDVGNMLAYCSSYGPFDGTEGLCFKTNISFSNTLLATKFGRASHRTME